MKIIQGQVESSASQSQLHTRITQRTLRVPETHPAISDLIGLDSPGVEIFQKFQEDSVMQPRLRVTE